MTLIQMLGPIINAVAGRIDVLPEIETRENITSATFSLFEHYGLVTMTVSISGPVTPAGQISGAPPYTVKVRIDGEQVHDMVSMEQCTWTEQIELTPEEHMIEVEIIDPLSVNRLLTMSCQVSYLPYTMLIAPVAVAGLIIAALATA